MDRDLAIVQHGVDEDRLRAAPPAQMLSGSVGAEEPEDGGRQTEALRVGEGEMLVE